MTVVFLLTSIHPTVDDNRYSVFDRLIINPFCSITALHLSSYFSTSSTVLLTNTKSSANNITPCGLVLDSSAITSKIIMKRSGISAGPCCNPTVYILYRVTYINDDFQRRRNICESVPRRIKREHYLSQGIRYHG